MDAHEVLETWDQIQKTAKELNLTISLNQETKVIVIERPGRDGEPITYVRFEDLEVWIQGYVAAREVYEYILKHRI